MHNIVHHPEKAAAIRTDLAAIFVSSELSRSACLITSLSPGAGKKMSKHAVQGGGIAGLLTRFANRREKARGQMGKDFPIL
jgi:transposase